MSAFERPSDGASFLVRLWREPGRQGGEELPARVYVRNLRSGAERYLKDLSELPPLLERELEITTPQQAPGASDLPCRRAG